jgi:hypothetical protein
MSGRVTERNREKVVFRDYPLILWFVGALAIVIGIQIRETIVLRLIFVLMGLAAVGFMSVLTVVVDHTRGTLNLSYRALFRRSTKMYSVTDVCLVNVAEDSGVGTYRVELVLRSGEVVPLRSSYSVGKPGKKRQARKLRSALGILDGPAAFIDVLRS